MTGYNWTADEMVYHHKPEEYGAIHFHDDDIDDARWEVDFTYEIPDLIKSGVNVPSCLIYNDDEGLSIMCEKILGQNFIQFVCKNILHVHARRHPQKRCYVVNEDNPHAFINKKVDNFQKLLQMSKSNIQNLTNVNNKFYEYNDLEKILEVS
jgi:hypothetical protein